nr:MAG TPA_asm: hypothetical protein [Caudoviricetes sp.]
MTRKIQIVLWKRIHKYKLQRRYYYERVRV